VEVLHTVPAGGDLLVVVGPHTAALGCIVLEVEEGKVDTLLDLEVAVGRRDLTHHILEVVVTDIALGGDLHKEVADYIALEVVMHIARGEDAPGGDNLVAAVHRAGEVHIAAAGEVFRTDY